MNFHLKNFKINFLVTCVGAYANSGIGTGGFVHINGKDINIIDKFDSTGLFKKGVQYYRFIRDKKLLVGYNKDGIFYHCVFSEVKDCHDIYLEDEFVLFVSTSTNQILKYNYLGDLLSTKVFDGIGDAWHINCLEKKDNNFYITAFGKFSTHREWQEKGCSERGILYNISTDEILIEGLSGPHHPRYIDGRWFVCDSHKCTLKVFNNDSSFIEVDLKGFTRGITFDEKNIYVGVSADRKSENPLNSKIVILNKKSLKIIDSIKVPFAEIYDIVICDNETSKNIELDISKFKFFEENNEVNNLIKQVEIGHQSNIELKKKYEILVKQKSLIKRIKNKLKIK